MARDFLGLAFEEMRVAVAEQSVGNKTGNTYARNKALQSAGMALELAYKALILGQGKTPIGSGQKGHRIEVLHRQVTGADKESLEACILAVGWPHASEWCRYMDETVIHAQRKYLLYDLQRRSRGVTFPTHGPASLPGIKRVFDKAFELADGRVGFSEHQLRERQSSSKHLPDGVERGPLIAQINIPEGFAKQGEPLGGIAFDDRTGEIRVMGPDELQPDTDR